MRRASKAKLSIYGLLEAIRKRPGMYLRNPTLGSLQDFLMGFSVGQSFSLRAQDGCFPHSDFSAWFCMHHRASIAGTGGWSGAIMDESSDERQAFTRFFEYLAAYRRRVPALQYHFALRPAQRKLYATSEGSRAPKRVRLTRYKGERCLFLHAWWRDRGHLSWCMHTGFKSIGQSRRWLAKVCGITEAQWKKASNDAA